MGRDARHRRASASCSTRNRRAPALGRGRRPLPDLRQLHDGLPDLLLHARSRTSPTWPASEAERTRAVGLVLHARLLLHRTAAASARSAQSRYRQWMTHKLGDLDRPVRHARAASAAAAASPGARSASTSPRRPRRSARPTGARTADAHASTSCSPRRRVFAGLDAEHLDADRGLRAATRAFAAGDALLREGEPADTFFVIRARHASRSRSACPAAAR